MIGSKVVIAGGGMVAGYAAKKLVELGLKSGDLAILSGDTLVPYERPPLSKGFLAGKDTEDSIKINPEDFYRKNGIEVRLGCRISAVYPERKRLALESGDEFGFEKLIVATGARPRTLDIPGAELENVCYLRSLDDSKAIRQRAEKVQRAAVIGGGFIAMEVAAVLAQNSIGVTMIVREDRIWKQFFSPQMSRFFEDYYVGRGVHFIKAATVSKLQGEETVNSAVLGDGRTVSCDMVVAGIGVSPVTEMLADSGIEVADGVLVNEYLETNQTDILAAGDVASYQDTLFGKRRRVEHWDNAVSQGEYCAGALMGERSPFQHVPYFFSDVFDLSYEFWGDPSNSDEVVHRGDLSSTSFSVWWLQKKIVVAAFAMNRPEEERAAAPEWIKRRQRVSAAKLEDASDSVSAAEQTRP
jgi:NADPH-dependent 2,4-dienoyl-CoA reductase/sulfur reductase-like enzyme